MRLFVGIPLPDALLPAVRGLQARLRVGRPVPEENLHLTLAFVGECRESLLRDLDEALLGIAPRPVRLGLGGLDLIGGGEVLALRVVPEPALLGVQARVAQAIRAAGVDLPRRRFRPHVTVARLGTRADAETLGRAGRALEAFGDHAGPEALAHEIALYRSHLRPEGAEYEILATYPERAGMGWPA